jgi:hypothetical protein
MKRLFYRALDSLNVAATLCTIMVCLAGATVIVDDSICKTVFGIGTIVSLTVIIVYGILVIKVRRP